MRGKLKWGVRATSAAAGIAAIAASSVITAQPAAAATGWYRCPKGDICLYTGFHGTGRMARFHGQDGNLANRLGPVGMNDKAKSVFNRSRTAWCLYPNKDFSGRWVVVIGTPVARNLPQNTRDRVSSLRPMRTLNHC